MQGVCKKMKHIGPRQSLSAYILAYMALAQLDATGFSRPDKIDLFHVLFFHGSLQSLGKQFF